MDNQATKHIKQFLTKQDCRLQLVEPHNHHINAAERAIQTFKNAFITSQATMNSGFLLQLWDKLTPQVQDTLNLMHASRINLTISTNEALNGSYNWNRYPLTPLGCKAVIYKDGNTHGLWASQGVNGWYLGPSHDHYQCNIYFGPETKAYYVSGPTELFPQHCQLPSMTPHQHLQALTDKLTSEGTTARQTPKGCRLLTLLQSHINNILNPPAPPPEEQRVTTEEQRVSADIQYEDIQRVIDDTPILTVQRISDEPAIMQSRNLTTKQMLKMTPRLHRRVTRNNTPGAVPLITRAPTARIAPDDDATPHIAHWTCSAVPLAMHNIVSQQALSMFTYMAHNTTAPAFTPTKLQQACPHAQNTHFEHFTNPMVHPVTGKTILSYKKLIHDPATTEVWQTVFGKDFGGMAQGDNKTGQKGTNAMFIMTHDKITHAISEKYFFTFANPVVDCRPQKEDPHQIQIMARGDLVTYNGKLSVRTADINTAKLHWNTEISTPSAKYMCLDVNYFISPRPLNILST